MWISSIKISNVRCFEHEYLELSRGINIFTGTNNSGKSTLVKCLALPQYSSILSVEDIRKIESVGDVELYFKDMDSVLPQIKKGRGIMFTHNINNSRGKFDGNISYTFAANEPENFIYPLFSHRKVQTYTEAVNKDTSFKVIQNLSHLSAKISRIGNPDNPASIYFSEACTKILGFNVTVIPSPNGQVPGKYVSATETIPLTSMGDGVSMIAGFLVNLAVAENKLFLIEEPENDLHPSALKELLGLIIESSRKNQFIISTHSNIVLRSLGQKPETKIFNITLTADAPIPTSKITPVDTEETRLEVLSELGYDFYDDESYNAWLFLEESSAERIIRDHLIRWFTPDIFGKIRTFSCDSASKVEKRFSNFKDILVYSHLEPKYKDRAWVFIDSGTDEADIIKKLRETYSKWNEGNFGQFSEHNFEEYYPDCFKDKIKEIEEESDRGKKRKLKSKLVEDVCSWIDENEDEAKEAFEKSAADVIVKLKDIEKTLKKAS